MSSLSFLITNALNSISDSWLASFSFSIPFETSSFPSFEECLSSHLFETFHVILCFLHWSVLTLWIYGVNFCCRTPVRFSGTVSLISRAHWSWAVVYVGSVDVFGFCSFGVFLWWVFPTSWVSEGQSVPHLLFYVVQVWACYVGGGSSVFTRFWGFCVALVQLFVLSNFSTI